MEKAARSKIWRCLQASGVKGGQSSPLVPGWVVRLDFEMRHFFHNQIEHLGAWCALQMLARRRMNRVMRVVCRLAMTLWKEDG